MWIRVHLTRRLTLKIRKAVSTSFPLYSHNICGVWTNFAKTIRTNKIVKWATMLFICTTKTIVRIQVFWNKFGWPVIIIVMGILMQNHKCNKWRMLFRFQRESPCKGCTRIHITMVITKWFLLFPTCDRELDPYTKVLNWCSVFKIIRITCPSQCSCLYKSKYLAGLIPALLNSSVCGTLYHHRCQGCSAHYGCGMHLWRLTRIVKVLFFSFTK